MKVLAQKLVKQGDQSLERRSENPTDGNPPKITKIKPFQIVKVKKGPAKEQEEEQKEETKPEEQDTPGKKLSLKKKK